MSEHQNIEWKQVWKDDYLQWISGFANAKGGSIFIGKKDNGEVIGLKNAKKLMDDLPNKIKNGLGIVCEVNLHKENSRDFIEIIVEPFSDLISYKGKFYLRSGSTNQLLDGTSLKQFLMKSLKIVWEEEIEPKASIDDIDFQTVEDFKKNAVRSKRLPFIKDDTSTENVLKNLELIDESGNFKRASVLLFGKNTQKFVFAANIKIGRFGKSSTELLSQEVVEGNAFELADKTIEILDRKYIIRNISYKGVHRVETPEYPFEAVREALFNAIIHRIYENTPVFVSLYDDRLTIWNQGNLNENLSLKDLKMDHLSYPRHKLVASVFYKAGYIEKWGRGTLKIIEECKKHGLPEPKIELYSGGFAITIFKDIYNKEYLAKLELNDRQKQAIRYIKENGFITNSVYRELFSITDRTAIRDFKDLLELHLIKKEGGGKTTKYIIDVEGYKTR